MIERRYQAGAWQATLLYSDCCFCRDSDSAAPKPSLGRADADSVTFKVKDYRVDRPGRYTTMTLATSGFIRRFLMHVLPKGLHRIRHYGLLASGNRAANFSLMRELLGIAAPEPESCDAGGAASPEPRFSPCPCCGGRMRVTPIVEARFMPSTSAAPPTVIRIDIS